MFKKFEDAQRNLSGALSRLLVVAEQYPDLKANQNFRDLQAQLEGTENRVAVARGRYIKTVVEFNKKRPLLPDQPDRAIFARHESARKLQRRRSRAKTATGEILIGALPVSAIGSRL